MSPSPEPTDVVDWFLAAKHADQAAADARFAARDLTMSDEQVAERGQALLAELGLNAS